MPYWISMSWPAGSYLLDFDQVPPSAVASGLDFYTTKGQALNNHLCILKSAQKVVSWNSELWLGLLPNIQNLPRFETYPSTPQTIRYSYSFFLFLLINYFNHVLNEHNQNKRTFKKKKKQ